MKDYKTSLLGILSAFIAIFTLAVHLIQGQAVSIPDLMNCLNALSLAFGLHLAADSTPTIPTK